MSSKGRRPSAKGRPKSAKEEPEEFIPVTEWKCIVCTQGNDLDAEKCYVCGRGKLGEAPPSELELVRQMFPTPPQADFRTDLALGRPQGIFSLTKWGKLDELVRRLDEGYPVNSFAKFTHHLGPALKAIADETPAGPVDINTLDGRGNTLVMCAVQNKLDTDEDGALQCRMIQALIDRKADVNHRNNTGLTALHLCYIYDYEEAKALLLANGADTSVADNQGRTPEGYGEWHDENTARNDAVFRTKMQRIAAERIAVKKLARKEMTALKFGSGVAAGAKNSRPTSAASNKSRPGSAVSTKSAVSSGSNSAPMDTIPDQ